MQGNDLDNLTTTVTQEIDYAHMVHWKTSLKAATEPPIKSETPLAQDPEARRDAGLSSPSKSRRAFEWMPSQAITVHAALLASYILVQVWYPELCS